MRTLYIFAVMQTVAFLTTFLYFCKHFCSGQNVSTRLGVYQGAFFTTPNGFQMQVFLSVPYAQTPPTRFGRTQPAQAFTGTYDATFYRPQCARWGPDSKTLDPASSEDCLYIKILSPSNPVCCLPVMVWYMGGGFNDGGFSSYDNGAIGDNFVSKGVIIVQVNFRQGPFGFFTTGTDDAPGNYGIWDALEALRFVRNHIQRFGGDPTRVTIMGQESGAVTAELLHLSPQANGFYSAAIYISGTAFDPVIIRNDAVNLARSQRLAITVGCDNSTGQSLWNTGRRAQVVSCLRGITTDVLTSAIGRPDIRDSSTNLFNYFWRPRPDGPAGVFPDSFENLALRRINVPVIMGTMKDDWLTELVVFPSLDASGTSLNINSSLNFPEFARQTCNNQITSDVNIYGSANLNLYRIFCQAHFVDNVANGLYVPADRSNAYFWLQQAGRVATSLHNWAPMVKSASFMRARGNNAVYMYSWDYDRSAQGTFWVPIGAFRYLEVGLLENFFIPFNFTFNANDLAIRNSFGNLMTNFAKFFNPTPSNYTGGVPWLTYGNDYRYLSFNLNSSMRTSFYQSNVLFWLNIGAV